MAEDKLKNAIHPETFMNAVEDFYAKTSEVVEKYDKGLTDFFHNLSRSWYSPAAASFYMDTCFNVLGFSGTMRTIFNTVGSKLSNVGTVYGKVLAGAGFTFKDTHEKFVEGPLDTDILLLEDENKEQGMRMEVIPIIKYEVDKMLDDAAKIVAELPRDFGLKDENDELKTKINELIGYVCDHLPEEINNFRKGLDAGISEAEDNTKIGATSAEEIIQDFISNSTQGELQELMDLYDQMGIKAPEGLNVTLPTETPAPEIDLPSSSIDAATPTPTPDTTSHVVKHTDNQFGPFTTLY